MFDIGAVELMVIGVVAIIVVGPKDLPGMLRSFGQAMGKMRRMAREFQDTFEEAAKDTGIDEITKSVSDVKSMSVSNQIGKVFDPITEETKSIKSEIDKAGQSSASPAKATPEKTTAKPPAKPKTKTTKSTGVAKKTTKPAKPATAKTAVKAKTASKAKPKTAKSPRATKAGS